MLFHKAKPGSFVSLEIDDEDAQRKLLKGNKPIRFDWENKWLRGDQYAHMLYNLDTYC